MTIDELPGRMVLPNRDAEVARWKRAFKLRVPDADTGPGTQPDVDSRVCADATMPLYAMASVIGQNSVLEEARGEALKKWGEREGVGAPRDALGASGYVRVSTSSGGGTVQENDELVHEDTNQIYRALLTKFHTNGTAASIIGTSTGTATNLEPGTQLKWTSPRPGISPAVTVIEQPDGTGLSGGREKEEDADYLERIQEEKRTRAASGNDAEYQLEVQRTPGVAVQKAFTYPGVLGSGTGLVVFTMTPAVPGGSRIPSAIQIGLVEGHVTGLMPGDDGYIYGALIEESAAVVYGVTWSEEATGWEDIVPWPAYYEMSPDSGTAAIIVDSASSATSFVLKTADEDYTGAIAPTVGKTIGFYDAAKYTFRRKRILAVSGSGPWTITVDTTNDVSDTSYTPIVGQRAMPWSDSLVEALPGIFTYSGQLGPGEQVASFYDDGPRQKRNPRPKSTSWPSELTTKGLVNAITSEAFADVTPLEGDGTAPSVGTLGVSCNVLRINSIAFFPDV